MELTETVPIDEREGQRASPRVVHLDRAEWESSVRRFRDYSYRQSWAYGVQLAARRGAESEHVAIRCGDDTIGLADVRIKRLPLIGGGLAFVSGGPLTLGAEASEDDPARFDIAVEALAREFVHRRGLTLRIVAPVGTPEHNEAVTDRLRNAGFRPSEHVAAYRTVLLDIDRPPDELRASFHRHWRRHLNNSERQGLEVSFGTEPDRFEQIARMSDALRGRKGFELDLDARFYAAVQGDLDDRDLLVAGLVLKDGTPVAGNITSVHGDTAVYLIGASTEEGLACRAGYQMHWRTIELARERGIPWYDLGGIDPVANPGVTSFKLRTNGADVTAAGPYELSPRGMRGRVTGWAERGYMRARGGGVR